MLGALPSSSSVVLDEPAARQCQTGHRGRYHARIHEKHARRFMAEEAFRFNRRLP